MSNFYDLRISSKARKQLSKLQLRERLILQKFITKYLYHTENPFRYDLDLKKLKSNKNLYRYRIGRFRIICQINKNELVILVININRRDDNTYNF